MSIRLISAKYEVNPVNIRKILNLLSSIYNLQTSSESKI